MCATGCSGCNDCGGLTCGEGVAGIDGLNSFTVTTAQFTVPTIGQNVTINVSALGQATGIWAKVGEEIFIETAGYYRVVSATATIIVATNTGTTGNANAATVIAIGSGVGPGGRQGVAGATGGTGTAGADGTTILAYERDGGTFTSLTYTQIRGPYVIPANSWETIGDTVRIKLLFFGAAASPNLATATNHVAYNFKMKIGTTDVVALPSGGATYTIQSNFAFRGILVEVDLVAKSFAPLVIEAVPKGNYFGLYSVGAANHVPGTAGLFLSGLGPGSAATGLQYQPSVFVTAGIDPTVANNFSVDARHAVVGTGGGTSAAFACPFSLVELLKK